MSGVAPLGEMLPVDSPDDVDGDAYAELEGEAIPVHVLGEVLSQGWMVKKVRFSWHHALMLCGQHRMEPVLE